MEVHAALRLFRQHPSPSGPRRPPGGRAAWLASATAGSAARAQKGVDRSSPKLADACVSGRHLQEGLGLRPRSMTNGSWVNRKGSTLVRERLHSDGVRRFPGGHLHGDDAGYGGPAARPRLDRERSSSSVTRSS